jgi:hypothetical protein
LQFSAAPNLEAPDGTPLGRHLTLRTGRNGA